MNPNLSELVFVLDRSSSMHPIAKSAISGFNQFLAEQKAEPGEANLTLVLFDTEILTPVDHLPISNVAPLTHHTYVPRGSTALLDAIGDTINRTGERLSKMHEHERPGAVIFAILTDGEENSSRRWSPGAVAHKIKHQKEVYNWKFLFLGANQDAIAAASHLNIHASDAASFQADSVGIEATMRGIGRKAKAYREVASAPPSAPPSADFGALMSDIVSEEDSKGRGSH